MRQLRIALVTRGDRTARDEADGASSRFANLFEALGAAGHDVALAIYDETFSDEVKAQLLDVDVALVWVNPIDKGRDRRDLDQLLQDVAEAGVLVSTHPDVIQMLGTKQVLYDVRELGLGSDTHIYRSGADLVEGLAATLATGARVLKRQRGSSGDGVWSVALLSAGTSVVADSELNVRHAKRGSEDELLLFAAFCERMAEHFEHGPVFDQEFQPRLEEGMIRCYLVKGQVAGFGFQQTNALLPAQPGESPPTPTTRNYFPETKLEFQQLKHQLENEWVPQMQELFDLSSQQLPLLWDCDFLLGPINASGADTYVLCEINVSSVSPYPESVVPYIVEILRAAFPRWWQTPM